MKLSEMYVYLYVQKYTDGLFLYFSTQITSHFGDPSFGGGGWGRDPSGETCLLQMCRATPSFPRGVANSALPLTYCLPSRDREGVARGMGGRGRVNRER